MIVGKLTISYDRGVSVNKKSDVGAALNRGDVTANGGIVRGLGSHFRSPADQVAAQARDKEAHRIYQAFRAQFLTTTIDGLYIVPAYGVAKSFVEGLAPVGIDVRVSEFELTSSAGLDVAELSAWGVKIRRQLTAVSLGRKKQTDEEGVRAIKALADCPILSSKTRDTIKNLVSLLETAKINRADFKNKLETLEVEVEQIDKAHDKALENLKKGAAWTHEAVVGGQP